jgi:hypothetical protein
VALSSALLATQGLGGSGLLIALHGFGETEEAPAIVGGGSWANIAAPRRRTKKDILDERIAFGILPLDVVAEVPAQVAAKARKAGTIKARELIGADVAASMSELELEFLIQRIKRRKRQQQEDEILLLM